LDAQFTRTPRPAHPQSWLAYASIKAAAHRTASTSAPGTVAPFDLMIDDIDAAHRGYADQICRLLHAAISRSAVARAVAAPSPSPSRSSTWA
jgi:hypothetical protein